MVHTVAIFRTNFTKSRGAAKAHIRYIQHRPGRTAPGRTAGTPMPQATHAYCCELAALSNPEQVWYVPTYHELDCQIYSPEYWLHYYTGYWPAPAKTGKKEPPHDSVAGRQAAAGESKAGTAPETATVRTTRTLFGIDGAIERRDAYRMVDEAEAGSSYFRIKISPDPKTEDTKQDL